MNKELETFKLDVWNPINGEDLIKPLSWIEPRNLIVSPTEDIFNELVPDKFLIEIFGVMAVAGAMEPGTSGKPFCRLIGKDWIGHGPHNFRIPTKYRQRAEKFITNNRSKIASAAYRHANDLRDAGDLAYQIDNKSEYSRCYPHWRMWPLPNVFLEFY
mgnify:FL=1